MAILNEDFSNEKYNLLREKQFLVIPNFLDKNEVTWAFNLYNKLVTEYNISGDKQCVKSSSKYNFQPFLQILSNKTEKISDIVGVNVLPTYCFARKYYNEAVLVKHKDREACEISLSIHLDGDKNWDLIIKDIPIKLNKGDAVLYWGHEDEHWREPYTGNSYTNLFLHYVRTFGPYGKYFFDISTKVKPKKHFLIS